tara:strand:- start:1497 stop:1685 length:189 start_codon:yes stop_codon:yes gene_type:complete
MKKNTEMQFDFSKFIKDIEKRETENKEKLVEYLEGVDELPQRKFNRLYREKWQNSIRYGRKK